jgi:hypothetical protein
MTKCRFCNNESSVISEYGHICSRCYNTLEHFEGSLDTKKMSMEELQILERIYTIFVAEYNEILQMIKTEIEKRRTG